MSIGDKIKQLRKAHNLNQTELGERLGVKTNAVSKWECGRVEDIPMSKIRAMAVLFSVPISYLIDDAKENTPSAASDLTEDELRMLDAFRAMPPERQKALTELLGLSAP